MGWEKWAQAVTLPENHDNRLLLTQLPSNVLIDIACLLEPTSVISLSRSCRLLRAVVHSHRVWSSALNNAARKSRVFVPSFPTEKMSIEELKAVSTRPLRFQSMLWAQSRKIWEDDAPLRPVMIRILLPYFITDPTYPVTCFRDLALIPGGRFLITSDEAQRVCLWDLDYRTAAPFRQHPLAIKQFSGPNVLAGGQLLMQPTEDGLGVVISLNLAPSPEDYLAEVHILEIYPTSSSPTFHTVAVRRLSASEEANAKCHNMTSRFFGYHTNKQIILWEYRSDMQSRIACKDVTDFLICGDEVLVLRDNNMTDYLIFTIPEPTAGDSVCRIEPAYHAGFPMTHVNYSMPQTWYASTHNNGSLDPQDIHLDVLGTYNGKERILHYVLTHTSSTHPSAPPLTLLRTHNTKDDTGVPVEYNVMTSVMPNDERCLLWVDEDHLWIKLSRGPPIRNGISQEGESTKRALYRWEDEETEVALQSQSFDPFSGRVCAQTWRGEIRIMDFVA